MIFSPITDGHSAGEPMMMGSPASPNPSGHVQSPFLPQYLLGDTSSSHMASPRVWSAQSPKPQGSLLKNMGTPNQNTTQVSARNELRRPIEKGSAPPTKSLFDDSADPRLQTSITGTPGRSQLPANVLSTPGMGQQSIGTIGTPGPDMSFQAQASRLPPSPSQIDPFYTQGESLTSDDVLDDTWVTVFGFSPSAASFILQQFSQYGNIIKHVVATEGNWMHLHYQSKIQAKKALSKNGKIFGQNIMVGVTPCINKSVMFGDKENSMQNSLCNTPGGPSHLDTSRLNTTKNTPIRPLTAAYKAASSENEVSGANKVPQKTTGVVSKAMEYVFGW